MRNVLIYDLPTRILHWTFAILFISAFAIAKVVDDESSVFVYHMFAGLTLSFVVILRLVWGFIGSKHSRFSDFSLRPKDLKSYFMHFFTGEKLKWSGHNPASSWAAILMFILALGLGVTGYLMTSGGGKEIFEDLHELLANSFVVVVALHVGGIILHSLRHRDNIGFSMIDGHKQDVPSDEAIKGQRSGVAILFVGLIAMFVVHLSHSYDGPSNTLKLFGTTLQLEKAEGHSGGGESEDDDDD